MKSPKTWLNVLATGDLIILFISWIINISLGASIFFIFPIPIRWYKFFMLFSSLLAFLKYIELATVLQVFGCFIYGVVTFLQIGIAMAFNNLNFWEVIMNYPLDALEFYSFFGFCGIAVGLLILEYRKYNTTKLQNIIS